LIPDSKAQKDIAFNLILKYPKQTMEEQSLNANL